MLLNYQKLVLYLITDTLFVVLLLFNVTGYAATITVNDTTCTLQEAINSANSISSLSNGCIDGSNTGTDTIVFDSTHFTTDSTISLSSGPLDISSNISIINDTGHDITIRRDSISKFNIFFVSSSSVTFALENLTIADGYATGIGNNSGGGIKNNGGTVNIDNCTFSNNQASGNGGAIYNENNGTITITNSTITGNTATTNGGGIYNNSGTVTLGNNTITGNTGTNPDVDGTFATNGSNIIGDNTGATASFPIGSPNGNGDYVGTNGSEVVAYTLTLNTTGNGNVSSTPTGIDCGTNCTKYGSGATVTLTENPQSGSTFDGWSGDAACASSFTITTDMTCTATFSLLSFKLTLNTNGNGTVNRNPSGTDCGTDCFQYTTGTSIDMIPTADNNYVFDGWSGDAGCDDSVTITADMSCTANFIEDETDSTSSLNRRGMDPLPREMYVFVEIAGNGSGRVTSKPLGIDCETADCTQVDYQRDMTGVECDPHYCAHPFQTADYVILNAIPDEGSMFVGWGGHPNCADDEIWVLSNKLCLAFFQKSQQLTVKLVGDGIGNIQSSPTGMDCGNGGSTCVEEFRQNSTVNLTAIPATGSRFAGWQGNCEGTTLRTPVKMDTAKECTAYFVASP